MVIKLVVIATLVATVTSTGLGTAATPQTDSSPAPINADPAIAAAYETHKAFLDKQHVTPTQHYTYGYECFNWKTGVTLSQYESRHGDAAVGIFMRSESDGSRSVVDYTVDTANGYYGVVRKDFLNGPVKFGYAGVAGRQAFASHPALEEYSNRTTIDADPSTSQNPLIHAAYRTHLIVINFYDLSAPFNVSVGYEVTEPGTGLGRSHYESYYGDVGEGSFSQIEADGSRSSIDYSLSPEGFAVTPTQTFPLRDNSLPNTPAEGYFYSFKRL